MLACTAERNATYIWHGVSLGLHYRAKMVDGDEAGLIIIEVEKRFLQCCDVLQTL